MIEQESLTQTILWQELEDAADLPEEADLIALCQLLDQAISLVPENLHLLVAGEAFVQLAGIYASRATALLDAWERSRSLSGPMLTAQGLADLLVRQSMRVDLSDLIEVPEHKYVRSGNSLRPAEEDLIAGVVDKNTLLEVLEQEEASSDNEVTKAKAFAVAHAENISAWVEVITRWFTARSSTEPVSLPQLQQELGMPLVEVWLGLLLGGFQLEQCTDDFYDLGGILVRMP